MSDKPEIGPVKRAKRPTKKRARRRGRPKRSTGPRGPRKRSGLALYRMPDAEKLGKAILNILKGYKENLS